MISEQEQVFDMKKSTSITKSFCMSLLIRGSYTTDKLLATLVSYGRSKTCNKEGMYTFLFLTQKVLPNNSQINFFCSKINIR